jgi:hypothetical protein
VLGFYWLASPVRASKAVLQARAATPPELQLASFARTCHIFQQSRKVKRYVYLNMLLISARCGNKISKTLAMFSNAFETRSWPNTRQALLKSAYAFRPLKSLTFHSWGYVNRHSQLYELMQCLVGTDSVKNIIQ